ncbi:MAG: biotin synthase [Peptococcaceae bacterium BRH_c4b]|nr:MAG: biotin synthase [Peptococcaceae bacterium BRH_c4b]
MSYENALKKIIKDGKSATVGDVTALLGADAKKRSLLYELADSVRSDFMGDEVHVRGIIEFSSFCSENCLYCGLRAGNRVLQRYRMEPGEIIAAARDAAGVGIKTIVLQSGQDVYYTADVLARIVSEIKSSLDVAVTLSLGLRPRGDLEVFRKAGADRYLLKHETADPVLFAWLRPGTTLKERLNCIYTLKELGYQVGSGNMVGLPGQTIVTLARDIVLLRDLKVEMAGIGPFVPNPDTPLGNSVGGDVEATLTVLAVARLLLPRLHLPATTSLGTIHKQGRRMALKCGANVIMPNVTPLQYRRNYAIYPGKAGRELEPGANVREIQYLLEDMGRRMGEGYGHSPDYMA